VPKALDDALWRRFDLRILFPKPTGKELARFVERRSRDFGIHATPEMLAQCRNATSYAEAEQLVISEARRRVLMT